jgi:hypothetical protein
MVRTLFLLGGVMLATPPFAAAQSDDRLAVAVEALEYLRKDFGVNMVLDGIMRAHFMQHGKATEILDTIVDRLEIRTLSSEAERRCSPKGFTYYQGHERFVSFNEPKIVGDSASIMLKWSYTPDGNPRHLVSAFRRTIVKLNRVENRWVVIGEIKQEPDHTNPKYCGSLSLPSQPDHDL